MGWMSMKTALEFVNDKIFNLNIPVERMEIPTKEMIIEWVEEYYQESTKNKAVIFGNVGGLKLEYFYGHGFGGTKYYIVINEGQYTHYLGFGVKADETARKVASEYINKFYGVCINPDNINFVYDGKR